MRWASSLQRKVTSEIKFGNSSAGWNAEEVAQRAGHSIRLAGGLALSEPKVRNDIKADQRHGGHGWRPQLIGLLSILTVVSTEVG